MADLWDLMSDWEQGQRQAVADAARALELANDPTFLQLHTDAVDPFEVIPLWQVVCLFKQADPSHWAASSPSYARRMASHAVGETEARLKDLTRLHSKALSHISIGKLDATGDPTKGYKTMPSVFAEWAAKFGEVAPVATKQPGLPKPVQRSAAQDAAILEKLTSMGHDPRSLPANQSGRAGVKAEVKRELTGNTLFTGTKVFDKAWERLAKQSDIVIIK